MNTAKFRLRCTHANAGEQGATDITTEARFNGQGRDGAPLQPEVASGMLNVTLITKPGEEPLAVGVDDLAIVTIEIVKGGARQPAAQPTSAESKIE